MGDRAHDLFLAMIAFVLGVLVLKLKDWFKRLADLVATALYNRLAGSALLARTALRRYTVRMYERHHRFSVSFRPEESSVMDMASVYVPLRTAFGFGAVAERGEATATLGEARRAVVLGVPGAGKTMLLRHTVLAWAGDRYRPDLPPERTWYDPRRRHRVDLGSATDVPVLLSLHSVDLTQGDLVRHIVGHFADHGFPNADKWVARALDEGRLALYFDGLDEVPTGQRAQVAAAIRKFMTGYGRCRAVVTCRVAVYRGEFNEEADRTLRVEEFDDRLVARFLRGWPWPPRLETDMVEQLLGALRDTPQLMTLARNPLLLTMIATLYSHEYAGTGQVLPHNRADFYEQVTVSLLRDRQRDARFAQPVKRAALQRLALAAQAVSPDAYDRLAMPYDKVAPVMRETLERYGHPADGGEDMLDEIVDRSGLLLSADNGERFQFAHLTLQEYLAATALADEPAALLEHYHQNPEVWRETLRLWCGVVSHDCSGLVGEILRTDPLLAFQCLADAQVVEDGLADEIVTMFHDRLGEGGASGERRGQDGVVAAFGLVAADRRLRGRAVFTLLLETAEDFGDPERARAAVRALAATHLPGAARFLASELTRLPGAKAALASMGDVAVAALLDAELDLPDALVGELLWTVRTPRAIDSLCELLGSEERETAWCAAFHLADLLKDRETAVAMGDCFRERTRRSRAWRQLSWWDFTWVWSPYWIKGDWLRLWGITATLAMLLREAAESGTAPPPGVEPDPRLVVPLALVDYGGAGPRELSLTDRPVDQALLGDLDAFLGDPGGAARLLGSGRHGLTELGMQLALADGPGVSGRASADVRAELGRRLVAAAGLSSARVKLLEWLRPEVCLRAVRVLTHTGIARTESWREGTTRLGNSYFVGRFSTALLLYALLAVAPCARVGAVLLGGSSWGVQGRLGIVFLALNAGGLIYFTLVRAPRRNAPDVVDRDQAVRGDIWTWMVCVVPLAGCVAVVEWWGTWASGAMGLAIFAGIVGLLAPLATPRALEEFLDEGLPSMVLPLVQD
ncbi:NACHT domain-containing protein [Streptomyces sp. NBC_00645]|uniref:NACHT domain-containing protein n=1 Tax=Streptomyces sp. NBC_00645 TaxID=2975795 RepID=UPI003246502D